MMNSDDTTRNLSTEDRLDSLIALVSQLSLDIGGVRPRLDSLEQKLDKLDQKVDSLEQKVDARLHETRPIWENVQQQLTGMRSEMESNFRRFDRKFDQLIRDTFEGRATLSELSNRVDKLEEKTS